MKKCDSCGADAAAPPPPGRIIGRARREAGLTQDQLLELAGLDRTIQWLSHLETKRAGMPEWREFDDLCQALGISTADAQAGRLVRA